MYRRRLAEVEQLGQPLGVLAVVLISGNIPRLWIPAAHDYIKVETIPMLGNGKVDLGQLRRIAQERFGS